MKKNRLILMILNGITGLFCIYILLSSFGFQREAPKIEKIVDIDKAMISVDHGEWIERKLPLVLKNLEAGTAVSLKTTIKPALDECVFVQTDYASARIYLDHLLMFEMGKVENYPKIMKLPGREVHAIETYGNGEEKELQIDYLSPLDGGNLIIYQPMIGSAKEILMERGYVFGAGILLSMAQILIGLGMIVVSTYVAIVDRKGHLFYWLGLFSMLTGLWFFCSNNASVALFPQSALLYLGSYIGLFIAPIVLLRFVRECIEFENPKPLQRVEIFFDITVVFMFLLQVLGLLSFHKSIMLFFIVLTFGLFALFYLIVREVRRTGSIDAKQLLLPVIIIIISAFFAFLQLLNPLNMKYVFMHQLGIVIFLLLIGIAVAKRVKESMYLQKQLAQLAYEEKMIRIQSEEQRNLAEQLLKNEEMLSYQRHNLRHHLAVIQELAGDNQSLQDYLTTMSEKIPLAGERFCENHFVNAIVSHFSSKCEEKGILFSTSLIVPETGSYSTDIDLCSIFANILENAVEACERMDTGERYVTIKSNLQNKMLTIIMDNSYNGEATKIGDKFRSAKRNNLGIGLASVQSIAKEYHGDAEFVAKEDEFSSSVYLSLV